MSAMRQAVRYGWAAVALALLYLGWVAVSRYESGRRMDRAAESRREQAWRGLPPGMTGTALRIPMFYANRGEVIEGEHAVVCYGVENARSVTLDPPVEQLKPALNRCFSVSPDRTTTYQLTAEGLDGSRESASFTLAVKPPPPGIDFVEISSREVKRGELLLLCYGVRHSTGVQLDPGGMRLPASDRACTRLLPVRTTSYTLTALDGRGNTDRERFTITVK